MYYMNIALRRFLHNHGNIATAGSPKLGLCPTLISNDFKGFAEYISFLITIWKEDFVTLSLRVCSITVFHFIILAMIYHLKQSIVMLKQNCHQVCISYIIEFALH